MPGMVDLPLRDIHLPESVSWWPLPIGWWLVLLIVVLVLVGGYFLIKWICKPTIKKEACKRLLSIEKAFQENEDAVQCLSELSKFLRRVMMSHQKMSLKMGGVTGEAWLELLDQTLGQEDFRKGAGKILLKGPYISQVDSQEVSDLLKLCHQWVKAL